MVNLGPLAAEVVSLLWGTPTNFIGFASSQRYCTTPSSGRQPNFTALNRGRHLYSAGRPSRWALPHILVSMLHFVGNVTKYFLLTYLVTHLLNKAWYHAQAVQITLHNETKSSHTLRGFCPVASLASV